MLVRATKTGWYGVRRRFPASSDKKGAGVPFVIPDEPKHPADCKDKKLAGKPVDFSYRWMEEVTPEQVAPPPAPKAPEQVPATEAPAPEKKRASRKVI